MILGRYSESLLTEGTILPAEWTESFVGILTETYFKQTEKDSRFFDVFGKTFDKEFVIVVSYIHHDDHLAAPISLFISHDILENDKKMKKTLDQVVNLTGLIFDDIFSKEDWNEFIPNWTENQFEESNFFYKITRENIGLTIQAEELLKNDGKI